eukprot:COSAG02_NODE_210_length_28878_cov_133.787136_28_plen_145_part_00
MVDGLRVNVRAGGVSPTRSYKQASVVRFLPPPRGAEPASAGARRRDRRARSRSYYRLVVYSYMKMSIRAPPARSARARPSSCMQMQHIDVEELGVLGRLHTASSRSSLRRHTYDYDFDPWARILFFCPTGYLTATRIRGVPTRR